MDNTLESSHFPTQIPAWKIFENQLGLTLSKLGLLVECPEYTGITTTGISQILGIDKSIIRKVVNLGKAHFMKVGTYKKESVYSITAFTKFILLAYAQDNKIINLRIID